MPTDLTVTEAISDLLLKADGMDKAAFADFLNRAAREQLGQKLADLHEERVDHFYTRMAAAEAVDTQCAQCA